MRSEGVLYMDDCQLVIIFNDTALYTCNVHVDVLPSIGQGGAMIVLMKQHRISALLRRTSIQTHCQLQVPCDGQVSRLNESIQGLLRDVQDRHFGKDMTFLACT